MIIEIRIEDASDGKVGNYWQHRNLKKFFLKFIYLFQERA